METRILLTEDHPQYEEALAHARANEGDTTARLNLNFERMAADDKKAQREITLEALQTSVSALGSQLSALGSRLRAARLKKEAEAPEADQTAQPAGWTALPANIVGRVLSILSACDASDAARFACVCSAWRAVALLVPLKTVCVLDEANKLTDLGASLGAEKAWEQ